MSLLSIENLSVTLSLPTHSVYAVDGISFELESGEFLAVVGESGSGKTQAMLGILGLTTDYTRCSGHAYYEQADLLVASPVALNRVRGNNIAMIFQDPMSSLNPYLRISTQLMEAIQYHQHQDRRRARHLAIEMLERVQIPDAGRRIDQYPHQFSGGMRQRIMIAMALLRQPKILIADEPTTSLDVTVQAEILTLLKTIRDDMSLSIILITHDLGIVAGTCDRVIVMYAGRIVEQASVEELFYRAKHPYTQGLIKAAQSVTSDVDELYSIQGNPPLNLQRHSGCAFYPRCERRLANCEQQIPIVTCAQQHQVACHLYDD
jgi:oligopeptide transport system ATP-binding protein